MRRAHCHSHAIRKALAQGPGDTAPTQLPALSPAPGGNAKSPSRPPNVTHFDYRRAEVRWIDQRWQLVAEQVAEYNQSRLEAE